MDKRFFFIASCLLLFALSQINADSDYVEDVEDVEDIEDAEYDYDDLGRQERGFLFKVNTSWYAAYKNFTATKLIQNSALLTTLLNASSLPFKTKKIALLSALTNTTVKLIIPKVNSTAYKWINKATKLQNSTKTFFNTSSIFLNSLLNAKLKLKNNTFLAKLQFVNASGIALNAALAAKANKTNAKLIYLLNTTATDPWGFKLKKNFSLLWADELSDIYNLTDLESALLLAKLNKTYLKNNDDDLYEDLDTYEIDDDYALDNNEVNNNEIVNNKLDANGNPYQYSIDYEFEYE